MNLEILATYVSLAIESSDRRLQVWVSEFLILLTLTQLLLRSLSLFSGTPGGGGYVYSDEQQE